MHCVARVLASESLLMLAILAASVDCATVVDGQDKRFATQPQIGPNEDSARAYLGEPPAIGFPHGERNLLSVPVPASSAPTPNGWQHQFPFVEFRHGDPDDPGRHIGWGEPLAGTSWLNRPWHVGWFAGALNGDDLVRAHVHQHTGLFGGYRTGWDFDHYWGTEARFGFANLELADGQSPSLPRTSRDWMCDVNLLYYPWGDACWRPYFSVGIGWAEFRFTDDQGLGFKDTTLQMPFGVGLKYFWQNWLALRVDVLDNLAFSSEHVDTMHNFSLTCGVEVHFGGRRRSYFPWNPGAQLW